MVADSFIIKFQILGVTIFKRRPSHSNQDRHNSGSNGQNQSVFHTQTLSDNTWNKLGTPPEGLPDAIP